MLDPYAIQTILISCACVFGFYLFYYKRNKYPPGPLCLPLIGCLPWYLRQRSSKIRLEKACCAAIRTYGNVLYVPIGPIKLVSIQGYKAVHEAFVKQADAFSNRPSPHRMQGQYEPKQGCQGNRNLNIIFFALCTHGRDFRFLIFSICVFINISLPLTTFLV